MVAPSNRRAKFTAVQHVSRDYFSGIPSDIHLEILSYLSARDAAKLRRVSQKFRKTVQREAQVLHNRLAPREHMRLRDRIARLDFRGQSFRNEGSCFAFSLQRWYRTYGIMKPHGSDLWVNQINAFLKEWTTANGMWPDSCLRFYRMHTSVQSDYGAIMKPPSPQGLASYLKAREEINMFAAVVEQRSKELAVHLLGDTIFEAPAIDVRLGPRPLQRLLDWFQAQGACPELIALAEKWQQLTRSARQLAKCGVRFDGLTPPEGQRTKLDLSAAAFEFDLNPMRLVYAISDERLAKAYNGARHGQGSYVFEQETPGTLREAEDSAVRQAGVENSVEDFPMADASPHQDPLFRAALLENAEVWHEAALELHEKSRRGFA